jgi:hypothetical protein
MGTGPRLTFAATRDGEVQGPCKAVLWVVVSPLFTRSQPVILVAQENTPRVLRRG